MSEYLMIGGGVTAPAGYSAAGAYGGIKKVKKPDVALLVSAGPAVVAGMFTTNRIRSAAVNLCAEHLKGRVAGAVVINSGNANACTGPQGLADARRMAGLVAQLLGIEEQTVFVCSTGVIGIPLPMGKVEAGIKAAALSLSAKGGDAAAMAIMTTDTIDKQVAVEFKVDGRPVRLGAMAKGVGMISPNMATMLAFLTTDAAVEPAALQASLSAAVAESFNRISVDGDQSTNDTVLLMANGAAGNRPLNVGHPDWSVFCGAVNKVTFHLASAIVKDGEGATKFVTVTVNGAKTTEDARKVARAVANSFLVKTSWHGADPNWGRVMAAVGYSGATIKEDLIDISYDGVCAAKNGRSATATALSDLEKVLLQKTFSLNINLNLGDKSDTVLTCDCSEEYVKINSEYMT